MKGGGMIVNGTVISHGTDSNPVYFTSLQEDNINGNQSPVWGDTNNDGGSQQPTSGCFQIFLSSATTESQFDHTFFRWGGSAGASNATMWINGGSHTLRNCHFENICWSAIAVSAASPTIDSCDISNAMEGIDLGGGSTTVKGCTIKDVTYNGIKVNAGTPTIGGETSTDGNTLERCNIGINAEVTEGSPPNPTIRWNDINDCTSYAINLGYTPTDEVRNNKGSNNAYNGIRVYGTYQSDVTWNATNHGLNAQGQPEWLPYVGSVSVPAGKTLNIDAGVVMKGGGMIVNGTVISHGTDSNPVYFTSLQEDNINGNQSPVWGDTNNDGGSQQPTSGCFQIFLSSATTESQFDHTFFRWGVPRARVMRQCG